MECRLWVSDDKASLLEKETGRTAMTDSRTSLSAINTIHIDLRALIYTLNVNIATFALYQYSIGRDVGNAVGDTTIISFLYKHKVFPTLRCLILFYRALGYSFHIASEQETAKSLLYILIDIFHRTGEPERSNSFLVGT